MGVAAILVMWPGPFEQSFVPASYGVSIWNMNLIGPVFFRGEDVWNCGQMNAGLTGILLAHPWAFSSGEQTRAKRSAFSQQMTTRQQQPNAKAWQTQDINNTNDPQKKYRGGMVSKYILPENLNQFHGANLALDAYVDQDTFGKVTKHNAHDSRKGKPFPSRWPQGYKEQKRHYNTHQHEA